MFGSDFAKIVDPVTNPSSLKQPACNSILEAIYSKHF